MIKYLLLEHKVDINTINTTEERTALHYASSNGQFLTVEYLLEKDAATDIKDKYGNIPLNLASLNGHTKTALSLLENMVFKINLNPDTNFVDFFGFESEDKLMKAMRTCTAIIHIAAVAGNIDLVHKLIERKGVEWALNSKDNQNQSLLHLSSAYGHLDIMESLIKHGSDIEAKNFEEKTPLYLAVKSGNVEAVKKLLEHKANIEALDQYQRTPLLCSAEAGHIEITKILLVAGANPLAKDDIDMTALHMSANDGNAEICDLLIKMAPSLLDALDNIKMSALHYAAGGGYIEVVKVLLQHGATIDLKNDDGETPLDWALEENQQEVVDYLKDWKSE